MAVALIPRKYYCSANASTLSSGITISGVQQITTKFQHYSNNGLDYKLVINTSTLVKNIPSDAALAFGQLLFTWPSQLVFPTQVHLQMTSLCPTGLSATAGEVGLGTVIASGASATLGAVGATCEDIMDGTTLSNHVAATTLVSKKANVPNNDFSEQAGGGSVSGFIDGTAGTSQCFLNVASTWDQTSAENFSFQANIVIYYQLLGGAFGAE